MAKFFKENCINNKGLSLVELMAAIAVASLVVIGCGAFMVAASKYFSRESAETTMQEEAQIVKNLLNNLVVDTQLAIGSVTNWDANASEGDPVPPQPTLMVFGKEKIYFIGFNTVDPDNPDNPDYKDKKLYYMDADANHVVKRISLEGGGSRLDIDKTHVGEKVEGGADVHKWEMKDWQPLADHVKDFKITLDRIDGNARIFTCTMDFELRNRTYKTSHTITLRNNIFEYNGDLEPVYSGENALDPTVSSVSITPSNIALPLGGEYKFESAVNGLNYPPQTVTWTVEGDDTATLSPETTIDEYGNLHISETEKCESLKILATSTFNPSVPPGMAIVRIGSLDSLTLQPTDKAVADDEGKYNLGQTVPFEAILHGKYVQDRSISINWSVTELVFPAIGKEGDESYVAEKTFNAFDEKELVEIGKYIRLTANREECNLYISPQVRPGARITLQAMADMGKKTQTDTYTITVSSKKAGDLQVTADPQYVSAGTYDLKRNGYIRVRGTVIGFDNETIEWSVSNDYGGRITFPKTSISGQEIEIRANNALDYNQEYTFTLTAKAVASDNIAEKTVSKSVSVKKVSIFFKGYDENIPAIVVVGQPTRVPVIVEGLEAGGHNATYKVLKYVRNMVSPYYANGNLVIAVTPPSGTRKLPDYQESTIQATLKNVGTVTGSLNIRVYNSNIIIEGYNYCYVPVPGDKSGRFPAADSNYPVNGGTATVNDIEYTYYVDGTGDSKVWGILVDTPNGNTTLRYKYNAGKFELVEKIKK